MSYRRTRQRQGRDFSLQDYLRNAEMAVEGNYNMVGDGIINNKEPDEQGRRVYETSHDSSDVSCAVLPDRAKFRVPFPSDDDAQKRSLAERLERMKEYAAEQDAERGELVDGNEPSPERGRG